MKEKRLLTRFFSWALGVSVQVKIMGIALGLVLLLGFGAILQIRWTMRSILGLELKERGASIARDVAARAADFILIDDLFSLRDLVRDTLESNKDVRYIFILDGRRNVLAHTFGHFLPPDLQAANPGEDYLGGFRTEMLESEEGVMHDVAVPIFEGRAGVVRVGMSEERLEEILSGMTRRLLFLIAIVSLFGVIAAISLTIILTKPLLELKDVARAVGRGDFSPRARVRFGDEIGQLGAAFNSMVENLDRSRIENAQLLEELKAKEAMRLQLLEEIISAQEDERKRVARELHDETSQSLTSLMVGLKALESVAILPEVREKAAGLRTLSGKILHDVHDLAFQLRPSLLDSLGLAAAIQRLAEDYAEKLGIHIDCQAVGFEGRRLPPATETALYRIVQEALTNVAKHAGAKNVSVILRHGEASVLAIVEDDGKGVPVAEVMGSAAKDKKLGLFGMEERAALAGGGLTIESTPGKGTTVFEEIKREIAPYTPEATQKTTGVHPSVVRKLTQWIAEAKALRFLMGYNNEKHFDGHQHGRLIMLIHCLTGHQGTTGSVDTTYEGWRLEGYGDPFRNVSPEKRAVSVPGVLCEWVFGDHYERSKAYYDQKELKEKLGFDVDAMERYRKEAEAKDWMPSVKQPRVMIWQSCNYFRHVAGENHFREKALPKVELIVMTDIRMCSSTLWADIVLPAAGDYECLDARETSVTPFLHAFLKPVEPLFERKSDWTIFVELSQRIQDKARARGLGSIPFGKRTIDLHTAYDEYTINGKIAKDEDALKYMFEKSKALGMERYKEFLEKGFVYLGPEAGKTTPIPRDRPYRPYVEPVAKKQPLGTNSGRFQFYIDHDWYLQLNAAIPKPQYSGGDLGPKKFPFVMDYPHTRWGIHSSVRTEQWMMRLQRGTVYCYLNPKVMARKGIKDGDLVRIFNDHGEWYATAKPWPSLPEYIVFHEHGWEHHFDPKRNAYNSLNADILNPLAMIGKFGHIRYIGGDFNPNRIYYETRVDVEKV